MPAIRVSTQPDLDLFTDLGWCHHCDHQIGRDWEQAGLVVHLYTRSWRCSGTATTEATYAISAEWD